MAQSWEAVEGGAWAFRLDQAIEQAGTLVWCLARLDQREQNSRMTAALVLSRQLHEALLTYRESKKATP